MAITIHSFAAPFRVPTHRVAGRPRVSRGNHQYFAMASKRVLIGIGDGSEEIEASTAIDVLRRAGADVTVASVQSSKRVTMSRGMVCEADAMVTELGDGDWHAVIAPGGMPGASNLSDSQPFIQLIKQTAQQGGVIAAICAAPAVVLAKHGLIDGKRATCYPAPPFEKLMPARVDRDVVVDGTLVTGTGPAAALSWSLKIVEVLYADAVLAKKIGDAMLVKS